MKLFSKVNWNKRSEREKTGTMIIAIVLVSLFAYSVFGWLMGTSTPVVVVTSGSMEPSLERGDLLIIQIRPQENLQTGDIIVFNANWHPETPIVHRIIEVEIEDDNEYRYFTKGDNNLLNDSGYRTIDDVLGVVILRIQYIGNISLLLQTIEGKAITISSIVIVYLGIEVYDRTKKKKSPKNI